MALGYFKTVSPLLTFLTIFVGVGVWTGDFYALKASVALLPAMVVGLAVWRGGASEGVERLVQGMGNADSLSMVLIYLLAGALNAILGHASVGSVDAVVNSMRIVTVGSRSLLAPGLFLASTLVALAIGTSMGTISAVVPIATGLAQGASDAERALLVAAVVSGATCGDNLSVISDTAIAACKSQQADPRAKFKLNLRMAVPAAAVATALFLAAAHSEASGVPRHGQTADGIGLGSLWRASPYVILVALGFTYDVVVVLLTAIAWAITVGIVNSAADPRDFISAAPEMLFNGMGSELDIVLTALFMSGLSKLMEAAMEPTAAFIDRLVAGHLRLRGVVAGEIAIGLLVIAADVACANNTVAIVLVGPLALRVRQRYAVDAVRAANALDVWSCVAQACLPHGAQLLLAGQLSATKPLSLMRFSFYPPALLVAACIDLAHRAARLPEEPRAKSD